MWFKKLCACAARNLAGHFIYSWLDYFKWNCLLKWLDFILKLIKLSFKNSLWQFFIKFICFEHILDPKSEWKQMFIVILSNEWWRPFFIRQSAYYCYKKKWEYSVYCNHFDSFSMLKLSDWMILKGSSFIELQVTQNHWH